ncbi:hypothetical protein MBAV_006481 [Candidatus Magnetobacterium bavaricum]|uniref:Uncharacterized protein n=1 Tax=Candidatus Magnetobacterium bavaricum TaxID=29290 RepID=A0A0F3GL01_9BACT|nr:hypothetical protein MBAV_006481 [Candidatus Magnetobacterium bavaricum]
MVIRALKDNTFCAVGFNSRMKRILLQCYLIFSGKVISCYKSIYNNWDDINVIFIKKGKIVVDTKTIGESKGIYYEINRKTLFLTELYCKYHLNNLFLLSFFNRSMKTNKFDCYLKKMLAYSFCDILNSLYLIKNSSKVNKIIIIDSKPNRFVLEHFCVEHNIVLDVCWLRFNTFNSVLSLGYLLFTIGKHLINGFTYRDKVNVLLYRLANWGLNYQTMFRDDFLIDNLHLHKKDIVFYVNNRDGMSSVACEKLQEEDYSVVDLSNCKLNIKNGLALFINMFIVHPFIIAMILLYEKTGYFMEDIMKFYITSLPHFLFLTNYNAKCHISSSDHGEISETIIMNRCNCKNILYHWSDTTPDKGVGHAFIIHNVYYVWGTIYHDYQQETYYNDKVEVVGCIFLLPYFIAMQKNDTYIQNETLPKILLCDSSFSQTIHITEDVYIDYLELIIMMTDEISDVEFVFKSKMPYKEIENSFTSETRRILYCERMNKLLKNNSFSYCDNKFSLGALIAMSDLVVNMSINSPATIALILRKEAVYYDITGNDMHPFTKYKNQIVFDDKKMLIGHVKDVLKKQTSAFNYIDPDLLNQYEPYRDSKALERLIVSVYNEANTPLNVI